MSIDCSSKLCSFFSIAFVLCWICTVPSYATFDQNVSNPCLDAVPVALDATTRFFDASDHASQVVRVDVPAAGLLSVSSSSFDTTSLAIVGAECGLDMSRNLAVVERSLVHVVVNVRRPGSYLFRVRRDPLAPSRQNRVQTAFVAHSSQTTQGDVGEDEDEIEADPDPLRDGNQARTAFVAYTSQTTQGDVGEDEDEIEADPDPLRDGNQARTAFVPYTSQTTQGDVGEDEDEIEADPDPLRGVVPSASGPISSKLHRLCRRGDLDDHGDVSTCATFLNTGQLISGELRNGWGDDVDTFAFVVPGSPVSSHSQVEFNLYGDVDLVGGLYDQQGQRLDWIALAEHGVRFTRRLEPGLYFVQLESADAGEGYYSLAATVGKR